MKSVTAIAAWATNPAGSSGDANGVVEFREEDGLIWGRSMAAAQEFDLVNASLGAGSQDQEDLLGIRARVRAAPAPDLAVDPRAADRLLGHQVGGFQFRVREVVEDRLAAVSECKPILKQFLDRAGEPDRATRGGFQQARAAAQKVRAALPVDRLLELLEGRPAVVAHLPVVVGTQDPARDLQAATEADHVAGAVSVTKVQSQWRIAATFQPVSSR